MQDLWKRFESWLQANAPQLLTDLNPPALEAELLQLTVLLRTELPADFLAFYRIHNGQKGNLGGLVDAEELLSVSRMVDEWTIWNDLLQGGDFDGTTSEPASGVRPDWWNPRWLPLTYDGAGNHCCLDLAPAAGGNVGQVIRMWHDDAERNIIADSFTEWMEQYVAGLESGAYVFSEDYDGLISRDDL